MATETIMWTVLPNGVAEFDGTSVANLSVVVSFRLEASASEGDTLFLYPVTREWTQNVKRSLDGFKVSINNTELDIGLAKPDIVDPRWWDGMFNDQTFVRPYAFEDYTNRLIISYPVSRIQNFLKSLYQEVGFLSPSELPEVFSNREMAFTLPVVNVPFDKAVALRIREQIRAEFELGGGTPPAILRTLQDSNPVNDLQQLMLFHYPPEKLYTSLDEDKANISKPLPPLPRKESEFERYMDFHQVISSLGDYPQLLRMMGIIIDLAIPVDDMPTDDSQFIRVTPQWKDSDIERALNSKSPYTAAIWDKNAGVFEAKSNGSTPSIDKRHLVLDAADSGFDLVQVDVDGAALKLINTFNNITGAQANDLLTTDSARAVGLPTMRSAGFSLNLGGRALHTLSHFHKTQAMNSKVEAGADADVILYAEDLLRGYRVDIWDTLTGAWHSLCRRVGDYHIEKTNLTLNGIEDEGFAGMGMTEPSETEAGVPPKTDDFYLHESLFRWAGWSLVAPRPGKTLSEQGDTLSKPIDPQPDPKMPFKLIADFKAAKRSLPRLRFGAGYRIRVRIADLAGNSPSLNEASEYVALPHPSDDPEVYYRFEPISSPSLFLRKEITEADPGESVAHLVIRTFNSSPDKDDVQSSETSERHIAAPPTTQLHAEMHGVFDDEQGYLRNDALTYNLIASREQMPDLNQVKAPVEAGKQMELSYLPDPLADGAAIRDLPGTAEGSWGRVAADGTLTYDPVPGIEVRPGSTTHIPYLPATGKYDSAFASGLQLLYNFDEGQGNIVHDTSNVGTALDLTISNPSHITWNSNSLSIDKASKLSTKASTAQLVQALQSTNEMTIELWITPADDKAKKDGTIVSLSKSAAQRNFAITQGGIHLDKTLYAAFLRSTDTNKKAEPPLTTPPNTVSKTLTHIVFTRRMDGTRSLYVNGHIIASDTSGGDFSEWNDNFELALGSDAKGHRDWLGSYHSVAIYNRALLVEEIGDHYSKGAVPPSIPANPFARMLANQPFRLILEEHPSGNYAVPSWDENARTLTVYLPKAEDLRLPLSSYTHSDKLKLMGVWSWIRELIDKLVALKIGDPGSLEELSKDVVNSVQAALEGSHWMLTPSRQVALVHAVQQPLGEPRIESLFASRHAGDTFTYFNGDILVHGKSTLTLNLLARWEEPVDNIALDAYTVLQREEPVEEINIKSLDSQTLIGSKTNQLGLQIVVGTYDKKNDVVSFSDDGSHLSPQHEFADTKHRNIYYRITAASRFREYFPADVEGGFIRETEEILVDVPSSARPIPPSVRYILPTYGWKREVSTNIIGSHRQGGGLRVYIERPWFASGEGELLGVILWNGTNLNNEDREKLRRYITQWGMDPIHLSNPVPDLPAPNHFLNSVDVMYNLTVSEIESLALDSSITNREVTVVGFPVSYDQERQLWYADIVVKDAYKIDSFYPFIQLALVRYQASSLEGMHISPIVMADFVQLAPDRSAIVTYDPYDPDIVHIAVAGYTYTSSRLNANALLSGGSKFVVNIEERDPYLSDDLAWSAASGITVNPTNVQSSGEILWRGSAKLPANRKPGDYRIIVAEYEDLIEEDGTTRSRLIYVDTIEV